MNFSEYVQCRRKKRHTDYLSALKHASQLDGNHSVVIYPCQYCAGGLHVGHQSRKLKRKARRRRSISVDPLVRRINRTKFKIKRVLNDLNGGFTNPRPKTLQKAHQRLTDLRKHLANLEAQLGQERSLDHPTAQSDVTNTPAVASAAV